MSISVSCSECGDSHHVNDRLAGRSVRCPSCDAVVDVPELSGTAALDEAVDAAEATDAADWAENPVAEVVSTAAAVPMAARSEGSSVNATASNPSPAPVSAASQAVSPLLHGDDDEDDEVLPRGNRPEEEMDMTPMVDVTFLLLIFFMVTAAFSLQKSIDMPRQQTDVPSTSTVDEESDDLDMVELEVDEYGSFLVMAPDWERETPGKQNLVSALREAIAGNKDGMRLAIKVHEAAKLKSLVDAMDAGTIAGFSPLEVTQVEEFD
jgi:biopolymer transport protein ExbD